MKPITTTLITKNFLTMYHAHSALEWFERNNLLGFPVSDIDKVRGIKAFDVVWLLLRSHYKEDDNGNVIEIVTPKTIDVVMSDDFVDNAHYYYDSHGNKTETRQDYTDHSSIETYAYDENNNNVFYLRKTKNHSSGKHFIDRITMREGNKVTEMFYTDNKITDSMVSIYDGTKIVEKYGNGELTERLYYNDNEQLIKMYNIPRGVICIYEYGSGEKLLKSYRLGGDNKCMIWEKYDTLGNHLGVTLVEPKEQITPALQYDDGQLKEFKGIAIPWFEKEDKND